MKKNINFKADSYKPVSFFSILHDVLDIDFKKSNEANVLILKNMPISKTQMNKIIALCIKEIYIIFSYVKEHLFIRSFDEVRIGNMGVVEDAFMDIELNFYKVSCCDDYKNMIDALTAILKILIKLGGARSVLKNNAISFLSEFSIFIKLIRTHDEYAF